MARVLNVPKRKCDVIFNGPIAELRFLSGPIYGCRLTTPEIERLVSNGKKVYEINPENPKDKVLLTIASCKNSPFRPKENAATENAVDITPVVNPVTEQDIIVDAPGEEEVSNPEPVVQQTTIPSYQQFNSKKDKKNKHKHQNNNQQYNAQNVNAANGVEEKATDETPVSEVETGDDKKEEVATEETVVAADM